MNVLSDIHSTPKQLIEAAMRIEGYDEIYSADAGNWEKFKLAEHTETALRIFDENFVDRLPVELIAPMQLAILAHDLGKPKSFENGEKHKQKEYNAIQSKDFLKKLVFQIKLLIS